MKLSFLLIASGALTCSGCAGVVTPSRVEVAQAHLDRVTANANAVLPFLSPERAARVRLGLALAQSALDLARSSATKAERVAAVATAEKQTVKVETATVDHD